MRPPAPRATCVKKSVERISREDEQQREGGKEEGGGGGWKGKERGIGKRGVRCCRDRADSGGNRGDALEEGTKGDGQVEGEEEEEEEETRGEEEKRRRGQRTAVQMDRRAGMKMRVERKEDESSEGEANP